MIPASVAGSTAPESKPAEQKTGSSQAKPQSNEIDDIFSSKSKPNKTEPPATMAKSKKIKEKPKISCEPNGNNDGNDAKATNGKSGPVSTAKASLKDVKVVDASGKGDNPLNFTLSDASSRKRRPAKPDDDSDDDGFADSRGKKSSKTEGYYNYIIKGLAL